MFRSEGFSFFQCDTGLSAFSLDNRGLLLFLRQTSFFEVSLLPPILCNWAFLWMELQLSKSPVHCCFIITKTWKFIQKITALIKMKDLIKNEKKMSNEFWEN